MKKIFVLIGMVSLGLGLVACDDSGSQQTKTPPVFTEIIVEDEAPFDGTDYNTYFKEKEDTVEVEVHLLNPYTYTITSVVINDYPYRFSKFETGSNFEKIIVNVPVGSSLGDSTYILQEIVYQDGETSKTVSVSQENRFDIYVYKENPIVALELAQLDKDYLELDFLITDTDVVLAPYSLIASLYSDGVFLESEELGVGTQNVKFEGLNTDNIYEVKVTGDYNLEDGEGLINDALLFSGLYSTLSNQSPTARIEGLTKTANDVTFDLIYNDLNNVTQTDGLVVKLLKDEVVVEEQIIDETILDMTFDLVLETSSEYTIKVFSSYNLEDGDGVVESELQSVDFITLDRILPTPEIVDLSISEDEVTFGVFIDDPNNLVDEDTLVAYIYVEDELGELQVVQTAEIFNKEFVLEVYDVFSNFTFYLEIRGDFDLNDGLNTQVDQQLFYQSYTTTSTNPPEINISNVIVTQGSITTKFLVTDDDDVIVNGVVTAYLYENGDLVDTEEVTSQSTTVVFNYLAFNEYFYDVEFEVNYNLRDGTGPIEHYLLDSYFLTGLNVKAPTAQVINVVEGQDNVMFDVLIMDSDDTLIDGTAFAELYKDGVYKGRLPLPLALNEGLGFTNLDSDSSYVIKVVGEYNLNNNDGDVEIEFVSKSFLTLAKGNPTANILSSEVTATTLEFEIEVIDFDTTIDFADSMVVVRDEFGTIAASLPLVLGTNTYTFSTDIKSETEYLIEVIAEFNLNIGDDKVSVLDDVINTTYSKELPSGYIEVGVVTKDSFTGKVTFTDDFDTIQGSVFAVLYDGGAPTLFTQEIFVDIENDIEFTGILSDTAYEIVVAVNYDLNTGRGTEPLKWEIASRTFETIAKVNPSVLITNVASSFAEITFDAFVTDEDGLIESNEVIMYLGSSEEYRLTLVEDENEIVFDIDLLSNKEYRFVVETTYNADDGLGVQVEDLATFNASTIAKSAPQLSLDNVIVTHDSVSFDATLADDNGVIDGLVTATIFLDGSAEGTKTITVDTATYSFDLLFADQEYEIIFTASYNLDDGEAAFVDSEIYSFTPTTEAYELPFISPSNASEDENQISFIIDYEDEFGIIDQATHVAELWHDGASIATIPITRKTVSFNLFGLLADNDYTIKIFADYSLKDQAGTTNGVILEEVFHTNVNHLPSFGIDALVVTQNTVSLTYTLQDSSDVLINLDAVADPIIEFVLYNAAGNELDRQVGTLGIERNVVFDTVTNYNLMYEIRIETDYNLGDGTGNFLDESIREVAIGSHYKKLAEASLDNEIIGITEYTTDISVLDIDLSINDATLYANVYDDAFPGVLVTQVLLTNNDANLAKVFTGLTTATSYTLEVVADYDLANGDGIVSTVPALATVSFTTN